MNTQGYLKRIGYRGSLKTDRETLEKLAQAHLLSIPFENFDIHLRRKIRLDSQSLYNKIVTNQRGGFCYELNGLFAVLLRNLGFEVDLLSARVFRDGQGGEDFDHMALRVSDGEKSYLVDIGFGDGSTLPLELSPGAERQDNGYTYRLHTYKQGMIFEMEAQNGFVKGYELSLQSWETSDFLERCTFMQNSVRSWFTQKRICVVGTESGSRSLIDGVLKEDGEPTLSINGDEEQMSILRQDFGLDLCRMPRKKSEDLALRAERHWIQWESRARKALSKAGRLLEQY